MACEGRRGHMLCAQAICRQLGHAPWLAPAWALPCRWPTHAWLPRSHAHGQPAHVCCHAPMQMASPRMCAATLPCTWPTHACVLSRTLVCPCWSCPGGADPQSWQTRSWGPGAACASAVGHPRTAGTHASKQASKQASTERVRCVSCTRAKGCAPVARCLWGVKGVQHQVCELHAGKQAQRASGV